MNRVVLPGAYGERYEYACDQCVTALCDEHAPLVIRVDKVDWTHRSSGVPENCPQCGMQVA